ncbi:MULTISPECIES: ribose-phosphate pyrophosphokinase [Butyrivibrio]|jgi:ribose-phosphate pyrophosphokinase|uniref:ribose-phosphate diphosphokinase n=1 Tax=Butyrivibrio fibrisolvens TaxID=831 RepID=A0A317G807_BUTFI|nr:MULTISPECIES: ribose-phosphate pyrophosphokinase [Butyrivibrio]PWT28482.1 phosphoribosylpyrophosphate synthetase [Butyrivibrio fibrisolvens]SEP55109.1 ribose-phosphate pyrophosphokinase [Butyrivibrio sp. TB]
MPDFQQLETMIPVAPLKLVVLDSALELGDKVDKYLVDFRNNMHKVPAGDPAFKGYVQDSYKVIPKLDRFASGEAKASLNDSIRGDDLFILMDVVNYNCPYKMNGFTNYKSPDDHYQDLKRVIAAANGKAKRLNVIMPFLYVGRQHRRTQRESLDAALMFKELADMGVKNFITFDAHDPRISNSAPLNGFDNFMATYQFMKELLFNIDDLIVDKDHLIVISPDEGALDRAVYFANVLGADTGMFYKRRDYAHVVNGTNPIVAHEFLGSNIKGKDVIIVDDMISSGASMIDTSKQLKEMGAKRVFIACTFGLFTDGMDKFDDAYERREFDYIISTNLTYQNPEYMRRPYYLVADMSKYIATIIDFVNHDASTSNILIPTSKIHEIVKKYNEGDHTLSELR